MDIQTPIDYVHTLHRAFVDDMYQYFGVDNPTYVDNIQFENLLSSGGHEIDLFGRPVIYIHDLYEDHFEGDPKDYFGRLNLDTTVFHESAHHLHYTYHGRKFNDVYTLELVIDCAMVYLLQKNNMREHINNLGGEELVAYELCRKLRKESEFIELLTASEEKALDIYSSVLGKCHDYLIERKEYLRELEEEDD